MEETIEKTSKQSSVIKDKVNSKKSVCGVMRDNTMGIIQKLESEMPQIFQEYSDLYSRYLHSVQDVFGTCNLVEKQYFDKMEVDQNMLNMYDDYLKSATNIVESQIGISTNFARTYIQFRLSSMDVLDKFMHTCSNMCAKYLSELLQRKQGEDMK